jgi:hypothetical protein
MERKLHMFKRMGIILIAAFWISTCNMPRRARVDPDSAVHIIANEGGTITSPDGAPTWIEHQRAPG